MKKRHGFSPIVARQTSRLQRTLLTLHNNYVNHILGIYHCHSCRCLCPALNNYREMNQSRWHLSHLSLGFRFFVAVYKPDSHPPAFISARLRLNGTAHEFSHTADCFGCACVGGCVFKCGRVVVSTALGVLTQSAAIDLLQILPASCWENFTKIKK